MIYNIFLVVSCILQVIAAIIAVGLNRITKFSFSWVLISAGIVALTARNVINIVGLFVPGFGFRFIEPNSWGGIFVSLCFAIGVFFIRKLFRQLRIAENNQRAFEKLLLKTVVQVEENERKRFASELHDGLGPILSSIKMGFSAISTDIHDADIRSNLEQAISEAIVTVREVSNNLSPHILNNFGIDKAVRNFITKITLPPNFNIKFDITIGDNRYSSTKEIVIYRVFCELFNNTLRHAEATNVEFSIKEDNGMINLNYFDDGIGFDPDNLPNTLKGGNGYYNIISRVSSLKGTSYFCKEDNGMRVEIKIPINEQELKIES